MDAVEREAMADKGRAYAVSQLGIERMVRRYERLLGGE